MNTPPLDSRIRAALDAFDERLAAEQINMRLYVAHGIVGAYVFDPGENPVDLAAAADRGDEALATIGAEVAREHGLPADWISRLDTQTGTATPTSRSLMAARVRAVLRRLSRPKEQQP